MVNNLDLSSKPMDTGAHAEASLSTGLDFIWLELTNQCNLKCVHCYAESGPDQPRSFGLAGEDWIRILTEAHALGCRGVQFIGGEPTLCEDLPNLIHHAHELKYTFIEVYTNGTRMNSTLLDLIKSRGVRLATSMYSDDPRVHDGITKVRGSHARTLNTIQQALDRSIPIRVGIIEMAANAGTVSRTISYLQNLGVQDTDADRVRGIGRGNEQVRHSDPYGELCGGCGHGKVAINSAGDIAPCIMSHFCNLGNVSGGIANILQGTALQDFRQRQLTRHQTACFPGPVCWPGECWPGCRPDCRPSCNP